MAKADDANGDREEALMVVRDARAKFDDAEQRALAAGAPLPAGFVDSVRRGFDAIESELTTASPEAFEDLTDRAERLGRQRAYVYPIEEVALEGRSVFADLSQWGVPTAILAEMRNDSLTHLSGPDQRKARGALRTLYDAYDYWGWYVNWYAEYMQFVARWLLALEVVALLAMVNRFVCGDVILGFVIAGVAGALVSVISRMPPLMPDADSAAYVRRVLMRVGTGTATALIGGGFIASGLLNVALPTDRVTVTELVEVCGKQEPCWPFSWWKDVVSGPGTGAPGAPGGMQRPAPATVPAQPAQVPPPQSAPATASPGVNGQGKTVTVAVKCSTGGILLLMAVGLLLGFSERALTTFEERLFNGGSARGGSGGGPLPPPPPPGGGGQGGGTQTGGARGGAGQRAAGEGAGQAGAPAGAPAAAPAEAGHGAVGRQSEGAGPADPKQGGTGAAAAQGGTQPTR